MQTQDTNNDNQQDNSFAHEIVKAALTRSSVEKKKRVVYAYVGLIATFLALGFLSITAPFGSSFSALTFIAMVTVWAVIITLTVVRAIKRQNRKQHYALMRNLSSKM